MSVARVVGVLLSVLLGVLLEVLIGYNIFANLTIQVRGSSP